MSLLSLPLPWNAHLKAGNIAPDFRLLDQTGRSVPLSSLLRESPEHFILLFFTSSFLPGDRKLLSDYAAVYPRLRQQGLQVAGISGINWETIHTLGRRLNIPFPLLFDPCCRVSARYRTMLIPKFVNSRSVFVITPDGIIKRSAPAIPPVTLF